MVAVMTEPEQISLAEYRARIDKVREALRKVGMAGLVAFGDCWRSANVSYFTEFRPLDGVSDIANAVFLLGTDADPLLLVSDQCLDYARSVTLFEVRSLCELMPFVGKLGQRGKLGLAGAAYVPASVLDRIKAGLGEMQLEPTPLLAEIKAIKSDAEVRLIRRAAALTDAAMAAIRDTLADGQPYSERDLALLADRAMLAGGAERTAYDTMVQAGIRSAYNLARPTDRVLQPGDLVMTDIGARYRGYVADGGRGFHVWAGGQAAPGDRRGSRARGRGRAGGRTPGHHRERPQHHYPAGAGEVRLRAILRGAGPRHRLRHGHGPGRGSALDRTRQHDGAAGEHGVHLEGDHHRA